MNNQPDSRGFGILERMPLCIKMDDLKGYCTPIERQPLSMQIAVQIERMIAERAMKAGERLPPERELARVFNVNYATIGMALNVLVQRGIVRRKVGSGTFVENRHDEVVAESLRRFCEFRNCTHENLMEVRRLVEPAAAADAARHATGADAEALRAITQRMETCYAAEDVDGYIEADSQFHSSIAEISRNPLLAAIISGLHGRMKLWMRDLCDQTMHERGMQSHHEICEAIGAEDPEKAGKSMTDHLQIAEQAMKLMRTAEESQQGGTSRP